MLMDTFPIRENNDNDLKSTALCNNKDTTELVDMDYLLGPLINIGYYVN
jgi:hypothetical protein